MSDKLREALEKLRSYNVDIDAGRINYRPKDHIAVVDAALAQPQNDAELEPVAWRRKLSHIDGHYTYSNRSDVGWEPLYTAPPSPERMREALEEWLDAEIVNASNMQRAQFHAGRDQLGEKYYGRHTALLEVKQKVTDLSRAGDNHASDLCPQCRERKADKIFLDDTHAFHICGDCWSTNRDESDNHAGVNDAAVS